MTERNFSELEIGGYYLDRYGYIYGPLTRNKNVVYPFCASNLPYNNISWDKEGFHFSGEKNPYDLITKVDVVMTPFPRKPDEP